MKAIQTNTEYCGTLTYMAPEVAQHKPYTKSVDMWSIGIIMHMLITGKHPFYNGTETREEF